MDFFAVPNRQYRAGGLKFLIFQSFCPVVKKAFSFFMTVSRPIFVFYFANFFCQNFLLLKLHKYTFSSVCHV